MPERPNDRAGRIGTSAPEGPGRGRRALLVLAAAAAIGVAVTASLASCGASPKRPNVLLLVMDTTRADRCGLNGYARPTTPRLDAFAKDATVFLDAWSPANWTGPAHASLFTGLLAEHHCGFRWRDGRPYLPQNWPTLAERFTAAGYDTACFTNNEMVTPEFGLVRGFGKFVPCYSDARRTSATSSFACVTHEDAAKWIEDGRSGGKPFFLFVNDVEPHMPYAPPIADAAAFARDRPSVDEMNAAREFAHPRNLAYALGLDSVEPRQLALLSDLYDGEIASLDREIGVLLDRLKAKGLLDSTVVVVLGDHGEFLGEHQLLGHSFGMYRGVLHVPLLIRFPGAFDHGRVVKDVVRVEDVPPTLLELCGLEALPSIDGRSLTRDLPGRVARAYQPPDDLILLRAKGAFPDADVSRFAEEMRSVFDGKRHLIEHADGRVELYDPASDPDEVHDLCALEPAEVERLRAMLPSR